MGESLGPFGRSSGTGQQTDDRFLILGVGAVGSYLGSVLAERATVLLADSQPEIRRALKDRGFTVIDPLRQLASFDYAKDDVVILAVKATAAMEALAPVPEGVSVISISNGFNQGLIEARPESLALGVVDFAVSPKAPGEAVCTRPGGLTLHSHSDRDATRRLAAALEGSAIGVDLVDDIHGVLWSKLILNASLDPIAALGARTFGQVFAHRPSLKAFRALLDEGVTVARAAGVTLVPVQGASPATLARILHTPLVSRVAAFFAARQARSVESVMLSDVVHGIPTEIDYLNGHIVRVAERCGVEVPAHRRIIDLVSEMTRGESRPDPRRVNLALID